MPPLLVPGFAAILFVLLIGLDAAAPGGRGFLVVTPRNVDSIAYFSTAHSLLFDRDFDLTNQFAHMLSRPGTERTRNSRWVAVQPRTGLPSSPYAIGYPLLAMPFLAAGTAIDALTGHRADGYGPWAERVFAASSAALFAAGLLVLHQWLLLVGLQWTGDARSVRRWAGVATLWLAPATAAGYYAFTVMSHSASFFAASLFFFAWWKARDSNDWQPWLAVGAAAGLMTLCRWQNALFLLIPAVYEFPYAFRQRHWWISRGAAACMLMLLLAPQFRQWHTIYGSYLTLPQGPQFLAWPPSRVLHVLFSSHNGLFFTTPATLVGAGGLAWAAWRERTTVLPLLLGVVAQVILVGSLPRHWHGLAFAMRLLISSLPLLSLGLLYLLLHRGRAAVLAWICLGSMFTLLSAVQWRYEFVPRRGPLTVDEAFAEKIDLGTAYTRHQAMEQAGDDAEALEAVLERFGESRVLLRRLSAACDRAGLPDRKESTDARLRRLEKDLLF